ncbi:glycoside hydrolase family 2 protein [Lipingzhangella sp. LS1_29]|uniref:beta-mannosidase n=1 Tax=Lipingzhangella rawalii TaxID=2055835 RepID=A0ABU2H5P4_9ACTN|nr:glycoside hydrolase family 2 protein [Lipingzhangella rawalii]MDS1270140.1 glycoside hydrolase family 2 protein [Lipingzhangella rawalii]
MAQHVALHDDWTLTPSSTDLVPAPVRDAADHDGIPATVPGCVHTDLLAAGLIPEPYTDDNERVLTWIGRTDWRYTHSVDRDLLTRAAREERVDLVCDGLDTVATVRANGRTAGSTANMHRSYRFDVTDAARTGRLDLNVDFTAPYHYAEQLQQRLGHRPGAYDEPYQFIRKMACNFGWDWGPTLVTSGIWRPIGLHAWSTARLARVVPEVTVEFDGAATTGVVRLRVELERTTTGGEEPLLLEASIAGQDQQLTVAPGQTDAVLELRVPEPPLWWPRGYGQQPLVDLTVRLHGQVGELDSWQRRTAFRTVELDTSPDADGTEFTLRVNDRPILVRGANWIPDDCFPSRITRADLVERVTQATEANMNLLRVWGGGRYECPEFYAVCDEAGVLVWQDFLFACAAYPEEEPIASEVQVEARQAVVDRAHHPSLVLWCGNNENIWGHVDWGWREELAGRSWGESYYRKLLPQIVAELDPTRPYIPGSPYSPAEGTHPNDPAHGPMHIWDVWNQRDYSAYREYRPRFVSEFGFQAPAAHATLRAALSDSPLAPDSPGMRHHQKAEDGAGKLARGLEPHLGRAENYDDWHYLTQLNQARAIAAGVEHFRAEWPRCTGTVVWQLNDCWPVVSWSAVDSAARRKPLWYALRHVYRERLVTLRPAGDTGLDAVVCNDTDEPWPLRLRLARRDMAGLVLSETRRDVTVGPRAVHRINVPPEVATPDHACREFATAQVHSAGDAGSADDIDDTGGAAAQRALWFFAEDIELDYPEPDYHLTTRPHGKDLRVTVRARTLLRDLALFPDRLDGSTSVDDALVTLLPGEEHTFTVAGGAHLPPTELGKPPVLRCVNGVQLVR